MAGRNLRRMVEQKQGERAAAEERDRQRRVQVAKAQPQLERLSGALREAGEQTETAMRSARNSLLFGFGDNVAAGLEALAPSANGRSFQQRYDANLAQEQARTRYDAQHRPIAQAVGQTAGVA